MTDMRTPIARLQALHDKLRERTEALQISYQLEIDENAKLKEKLRLMADTMNTIREATELYND